MKNNGGPAFPHGITAEHYGMSLRAYAAIKLKVPDSGIDWLDEMILKSKRDELAAKAMQSLLLNNGYYFDGSPICDATTRDSYTMADTMIAEGKK